LSYAGIKSFTFLIFSDSEYFNELLPENQKPNYLIAIINLKSKIMKTISKFLLLFGIITIILSGCSKDDSSSDSKSGNNALTGNVLKGKISTWTLGTGYTLKASQYYYSEVMGSSIISSDGSFSITLSVPLSDYLSNITYYFSSPPLVISDPTSLCTYLDLNVYDVDGYQIGSVVRSNSIANNGKGYASVEYMYSSKKTTITGTRTYDIYNYIYNVSFKEGWNTLVGQIANSSETAVDYKIGNTEPSSVIWKFSSK
jgi:hypothetical protein